MTDSTEKKEIRKIPCEVYSRIVGYLRPIRDWNVAKRQEFKDRTPYLLGEQDERKGTGPS